VKFGSKHRSTFHLHDCRLHGLELVSAFSGIYRFISGSVCRAKLASIQLTGSH